MPSLKFKVVSVILQLVLFAVALFLLLPNLKWQVSVGLFLFFIANNLMISSNITDRIIVAMDKVLQLVVGSSTSIK